MTTRDKKKNEKMKHEENALFQLGGKRLTDSGVLEVGGGGGLAFVAG